MIEYLPRESRFKILALQKERGGKSGGTLKEAGFTKEAQNFVTKGDVERSPE